MFLKQLGAIKNPLRGIRELRLISKNTIFVAVLYEKGQDNCNLKL